METFERLASLDFAHPVLSVFDDPEREVPVLQVGAIYTLQADGAGQEGQRLAAGAVRLGPPALVESRLGDGMVILAAFPDQPRWTNLPTKPDSCRWCCGWSATSSTAPRWRCRPWSCADGVAEYRSRAAWDPAVGKVTDPAGRSTPVALERSGSRLLGAFERTARARLLHRGRPQRAATQDQGGNLDFAVNLAPEESDFTVLDEQQLQQLLPGLR